ncbi:proprotein convertase P-domain-containing protein [Limnohabitans sp.]|uniref:proprotein convertase P-domain-containing protein n=1 Tax=Limnohabitans sp. TaxID=1907725 RepID=UPI002AFE2A0E|nr:proprotein convertase P-domain-containing protein [Limnohabitans sp.]
MRSTLWTGLFLTLTAFLASCGGGGGSPPPTTTSTQPSATSCDSNILWAAHPATSGREIADNDGTGISVRWDNQNCSLRNISSATVEICLDHPRPRDLTWTISSPGFSAPLTLTPPADWNGSGSACGSVPGKLQRIDLLTLVTPTATRGNWTLNVKDQQLGVIGHLIQWRISISGTT